MEKGNTANNAYKQNLWTGEEFRKSGVIRAALLKQNKCFPFLRDALNLNIIIQHYFIKFYVVIALITLYSSMNNIRRLWIYLCRINLSRLRNYDKEQ